MQRTLDAFVASSTGHQCSESDDDDDDNESTTISSRVPRWRTMPRRVIQDEEEGDGIDGMVPIVEGVDAPPLPPLPLHTTADDSDATDSDDEPPRQLRRRVEGGFLAEEAEDDEDGEDSDEEEEEGDDVEDLFDDTEIAEDDAVDVHRALDNEDAVDHGGVIACPATLRDIHSGATISLRYVNSENRLCSVDVVIPAGTLPGTVINLSRQLSVCVEVQHMGEYTISERGVLRKPLRVPMLKCLCGGVDGVTVTITGPDHKEHTKPLRSPVGQGDVVCFEGAGLGGGPLEGVVTPFRGDYLPLSIREAIYAMASCS